MRRRRLSSITRATCESLILSPPPIVPAQQRVLKGVHAGPSPANAGVNALEAGLWTRVNARMLGPVAIERM